MSHLQQAEQSPDTERIFDADTSAIGYLPNYTRLFAHSPAVYLAWQQLNGAVKAEMELRRYELVALRETRLALMRRQSFLWLFEHSAAFNRFLVHQFNERLAQFIALAETERTLDATGRLARNLAWLFNPTLYPDEGRTLEVSQEELGLLAGMSRQIANQSLGRLADLGLLEVGHGSVTILDVERLARYEA